MFGKKRKQIDFLTSNYEGFSSRLEQTFLTEQRDTAEDVRMVSSVQAFLFSSFARASVSLIRFSVDGGCISKDKKQNTRKWQNSGIINPLLDGLTYNTCGHFARYSYSQNIRAYYMLNHPIRCIYFLALIWEIRVIISIKHSSQK